MARIKRKISIEINFANVDNDNNDISEIRELLLNQKI